MSSGDKKNIIEIEKNIKDAGERALKEAKERKSKAEALGVSSLPKEINGRNGPEPTRFGDWEKGGLISDF